MENGFEHDGAAEEEWLAVTLGAGDGKSVPLTEQEARLFALVLEARFIPCRIEPAGLGQRLLVPVTYYESALHELRLYEEENRDWPPPEPPSFPLAENALATFSVLILLATFHNLTQLDIVLPGRQPIDWVSLGNAHAAKILAGQWWRLFTSLTLHADWLHLFSNLAIGGIFIVFLCREVGAGLAWSLILGSGALGNLANAWLQSPDHRSVGASTAVFGAVGILAALSFIRNRRLLRGRQPLPVAAALALLALLGTEGKQTDLGAHLFGFLCGIGLGLVAAYLTEKYGLPGRRVNALLAILCGTIIVWSWWAALTQG